MNGQQSGAAVGGATYSEETERLRFRPAYRQLSDEEAVHAGAIKDAATKLSLLIHDVKGGKPSREKSLAITKLEESIMWGIKALTACLLVALALMHAPTAYAAPLVDDHSINNSAAAASAANASNVNAPVTVNTNTATGGNASASNANANTATGGSVRDSGNSSNRNTNLQGQLQGQGQGQSQTITNPRQPVSTAQATALTAAPETCMGSSSIGGQGVGFGLSFGTTWTDDACQARMDARELARLGYADAARARLCQSEGVRMAFEATGQSCAAATPAPAPAPVGGTSEPMQPIE